MRSGKAPDSRARHLAEQKNIVMVNLFLLTRRCMQIVDRYDQRLRLMIKINFHTYYTEILSSKLFRDNVQSQNETYSLTIA